MRTASIQEKGTLTTSLGIAFPRRFARPHSASTLEQQHPHTCRCSPSTQPRQAQLPATDYSCQKHNNLLGRFYVRTVAGRGESICTLKRRFGFLPPRSSPTMTFCCCCNTSVCNTFPTDFSERKQDSLSVQPGRPR